MGPELTAFTSEIKGHDVRDLYEKFRKTDDDTKRLLSCAQSVLTDASWVKDHRKEAATLIDLVGRFKDSAVGSEVEKLGQSVLIKLCSQRLFNEPEVASELVKAGVDPNGPSAGGRTALHEAIDREGQDGALCLIELGARNRPDDNGVTPLHLACEKKSLERVVTALVDEMEPEDVGKPDRWGSTPLHRACTSGNEDVAMMLIDRMQPEDLGRQTAHFGRTALMSACVNGLPTIALKLVGKMNPDDLPLTDGDKHSALDHACEKGLDEVAREIVKKDPGQFSTLCQLNAESVISELLDYWAADPGELQAILQKAISVPDAAEFLAVNYATTLEEHRDALAIEELDFATQRRLLPLLSPNRIRGLFDAMTPAEMEAEMRKPLQSPPGVVKVEGLTTEKLLNLLPLPPPPTDLRRLLLDELLLNRLRRAPYVAIGAAAATPARQVPLGVYFSDLEPVQQQAALPQLPTRIVANMLLSHWKQGQCTWVEYATMEQKMAFLKQIAADLTLPDDLQGWRGLKGALTKKIVERSVSTASPAPSEDFRKHVQGLSRQFFEDNNWLTVSSAADRRIIQLRKLERMLYVRIPEGKADFGGFDNQIEDAIRTLQATSKDIRAVRGKIDSLEEDSRIRPPAEYSDPVWGGLMETPVVVMVRDEKGKLVPDSGTRYERSNVEGLKRSPMQRRDIVELRDDEKLKGEIEEWKKEHPEYEE